MKILVFGDIMGRIGREAVKQALPGLKARHSPDLIIANAENLAHGKGVTPDVINEMVEAGVDVFTSGNHVWDRNEVYDVLADAKLADRLIRPANYPPGVPGTGAKFLTIGTKNVLVLNLLGRVFGRVECDDPFRTFDALIAEHAPKRPDFVLVDFHAEATSEKMALAWYADGRATAIWGTHTHVPTRDERTLPGGTAYITDAGMCGARDSVIGVAKEPIIRHFLTQLPSPIEVPEEGDAVVNAVIITAASGKAAAIEHFQQIIEIH